MQMSDFTSSDLKEATLGLLLSKGLRIGVFLQAKMAIVEANLDRIKLLSTPVVNIYVDVKQDGDA